MWSSRQWILHYKLLNSKSWTLNYIQSHLSDAQFEMSFAPTRANNRINFVKWLINRRYFINRYKNLDQYIEEDILNEEHRAYLAHYGIESFDQKH